MVASSKYKVAETFQLIEDDNEEEEIPVKPSTEDFQVIYRYIVFTVRDKVC